MKPSLKLALILILAYCGLGFESLADEQVPQTAKESGYISIGGIEQWVRIEGTNVQNPILLIVHGGPGNPLSLYHESLYRTWENDFTIVHWDQRGSGKTFEANQETGELTMEKLAKTDLDIELLISDGLEVTDYLRKRFGHEKLILSGTSWGSVLAVRMAVEAPEKYHFYVGLSQLVNYHQNMPASFNLVRSMAEKRQDQTSIETLEAIGSPPWQDPRSFGKLRRIIRFYENEIVSPLPDLKIGTEYQAESTRAAYFSGEEFSFVKFVGLKGDGMAQKIALDKCCTKFEIPVYFIQGQDDLLTTAKVTESYFQSLKAPSKEYIPLEKCGHDPNIRMLKTQLDTLRAGIKTHLK